MSKTQAGMPVQQDTGKNARATGPDVLRFNLNPAVRTSSACKDVDLAWVSTAAQFTQLVRTVLPSTAYRKPWRTHSCVPRRDSSRRLA